MPKLKDIIAIIEEFAPLSLQWESDNCGLLYGDVDKEITSVLITLDLTPAVLAEAIEKGVGLIIEHHPSIFIPLHKINHNNPTERAFFQCIDRDIAVYAAHTTVDFTSGGMSDYAASLLGADYLSCAGDVKIYKLKSKCSLSQLYENAVSVFEDKNATYIGEKSLSVERFGIVTGGGGGSVDDVETAKSLGADVFITGDIKYHVARWTKDSDYAMINIGHYNTEIIFLPLMEKVLSRIKGLEIIRTTRCYNPYN